MKKQTAANNELLKIVKKIMNSKVYAETARRMNEFNEKDALCYVQQYFSNPIDLEYLKNLAASKGR